MGGFERPCGFQYNDSRAKTQISCTSPSFLPSPSKSFPQQVSTSSYQTYDPYLTHSKDNQGNHLSPTSLFLSYFSGSKERPVLQINNRPISTQQIPCHSFLQDGICHKYSLQHNRTPLGLHNRSHGRLFSRPNPLVLPNVLRLCSRQPYFRFPVHALRSLHSPLDIHEDNKASQSSSPQVIYSSPLFPRRLFPSGQFPRGLIQDHCFHPGSFPKARISSQPKEIQSLSFPESGILRRDFPPRLPTTFSPSVKDSFHLFPLQKHLDNFSSLPTPTRELPRPTELGLFSSPSRPTKASPSDFVDELLHKSSVKRPSSSSRQIFQIPSPSLAGSKLLKLTSSHEPSSSISPTHDRRISVKMVRNFIPAGPQDLGELDSRGSNSVGKLVRTESDISVSTQFPSPPSRSISSPPFRQHNFSGMHKESRDSEISTTNDPLSTNSQFLPSPLNNVSPQTPKRCPERLSGPRVPPHSSGNRVVSGSENLHLDSNASPEVPSRSLCHQGQQEGPQLRLPISRPSSLRSQCSFSSMGQLGLNLPIPPSSDSSSSHFSTFHLRRQRGPDSTILCSIRMVSQSPSSSSQPLPPSPFSHSLSNNYLRYNIPPQSWSFTTSRLDSIKRALLLKGHSRRSTKMILRCHKDSTNKTYECIWRKFLSFLSTRNIPHSTISIPIVCDFIEFQCTTMQRKYRTLATYKCALRYPILIACNLDINSLTTDLFMRGIFNYNPPIKAKGMPTWSINSVLRFLRSPVFEPLESASFVRLTQKALLLILLASGRRISEIANLSRSSTYLHARKALSLGWVEGFSPKNRTPNFSPENPSIGFLALNSIEDNNLCPVRAYKMYLLKSRELIDNFPLPPLPKCLWVRRRSSRPVNIKYLTDSLKNLIQDSRNFNNLNANIPIGPHQVKKLSASLAYQVGQDEIRVKQVMGFSSLSILRKNYVAYVRPLDIQCVLPGGTFTP